MNETLTCAFGHTWTRPVTRGHKPKLCPEHRQADTEARAAAAAKARAEAAEPTTRVKDEALDILTDPQVSLDPEYVRKLQYVIDHIDEPTGARLAATQVALINEYNRRFKRSAELLEV